MLIPTHRIIAKIILNEIKNSSEVKLEDKFFIYGNVLPDIAPKYIKTKHFIDCSIDFLIDKIYILLNNNNISMRKFSVELGVITHYICDYFCDPHYDRSYFKGKVNEHLLYEKLLHSKFKKYSNLKEFNEHISLNNHNSIKDFIYIMLDKYIIGHKSCEKDIDFSLFVSVTVALYIIENSKFYLKYLELAKCSNSSN
ncbi:MAG: zinc dependent phospholipase C family protein [Filifactoraceae bacterium]